MRKINALSFLAIVAGVPLICSAAPRFSVVEPGTSASSASIIEGTSSFTINVVLDTDDARLGSLFYTLSTDAPGLTFGTPAITVLGAPSPLDSSDLVLAPSPGNAVNNSATMFVIAPNKPQTDYDPFNAAIASYTLDTSTLPVGSYTFTAVGQEMAFGSPSTVINEFDNPGVFTLNVDPIPEPTVIGILGLFALTMLRRRHD